jgi:hypothetical protein
VKLSRQCPPNLFGVLRVLQHKRALNVGPAVTPAGKLEVTIPQRPGFGQHLENILGSHRRTPRQPSRTDTCRVSLGRRRRVVNETLRC